MGYRMLAAMVMAFCGVFLLIVPRPYMLPSTIAWLVAVFVSTAILIKYHARNTLYTCVKCGHVFGISAMTDAFRPHTPNSKYLKCPKCGESGMFEKRVRNTD